VHAVDVADDLLEHVADVLEPTTTARRARALLPHADSSALPRIEYSSSEPCAFTRTARRRRADGRAEQHVVREDEVGGQVLAQRRGVQLDVALALARVKSCSSFASSPRSGRARRRAAAADVGPHDVARRRGRTLGMRLLREDDDVVPARSTRGRARAV
jgi:hypothetical protein